MRIDLVRVAAQVSFSEIQAHWHSKDYRPQAFVMEADYEQYRRWLAASSREPKSAQLSLELL